jgi:hypothetical protein
MNDYIVILILLTIFTLLEGAFCKATFFRSKVSEREESAEQISVITFNLICIPIKIYREICTVFGWHAVVDVKIRFV